jgi:ferredoxin
MKAKITNFDVNWLRIKQACMTTISKQAGKEPNNDWKRKLLICQHSPIRRGNVSWKWEAIPYAISTHFARHHEGCEKYISTSRGDRTEIKDRSKRSQMDNVMMEMDANIQALINISEKRLCMCADPTTRKYWQDVIEEIREYDENIYWVLVPQCIRCGACVEPFSDCKYFEKFGENLTKEELMNIMVRYDKYNEYRDKKRIK